MKWVFSLLFILVSTFVFTASVQASDTVVLQDQFENPTLDLTKWTSLTGHYGLEKGGLGFHKDQSPFDWGDAAVYSKNTFENKPGRSLNSFVRASVFNVEGVYSLFSPFSFADPTPNSMGVGYSSFGANGGRNLFFAAMIPGQIVPYKLYTAEGNDYLFTTVLRPSGSLHFVSGDPLDSFPDATLIWVNDKSQNGPFYLGFDSKKVSSGVLRTSLIDLEGDFATQYGLATLADTFQRSDNPDLGSTEIGNKVWQNNNVKLQNNMLVSDNSESSASVYTDSGVSEGIFEVSFKTPASSGSALSYYFRYQDENNWWKIKCSVDRIEITKNIGGNSTVIYPQPTSQNIPKCDPDTNYRLVVRAHGSKTTFWLNDTNIAGLDPLINDSDLLTATGIKVELDPGASPQISKIAVWPKTVALPASIGPFPTLPKPGSNVLIEDSFTDANGKSLTEHTPEIGGPWKEEKGSWVINSNTVVPSHTIPSSIATIDSGTVNHAITTKVNLSSGTGWGTTNGWEVGPIIRYKDNRNYTWARFLWQNTSPEIEVWEIVNGNGRFLNAKNITGLVNLGETHTMTAAIIGKKIAIYLDGKLIQEAETRILEGTRVGMVMDNEPINISNFDHFTVNDTNDDVVPPSEVTDLSFSISTPTLYLNWGGVGDDASGIKFYRIYRSTDGSLGTQINQDGQTTTTSYTDSSNLPTAKYYYTVRAVDWYGNENTSSFNKQIAINQTYVPPAPPNTPTTPLPVNVTLNPSFETTNTSGFAANWSKQNDNWRDTNNKKTGSASMGIKGPVSGTSSLYSNQTVTLTPNTKYVLSGWVKTDNVTGGGITLRYAQTNPSVALYQTQTIKGTNDWTFVSTTFTTTDTYQAGRVDIVWNLKPGDMAYVDDVKLERITYPNLVKNASFETLGTNGYPTEWWYRPTASSDTTVKKTGNASLKMFGPANAIYAQQALTLKPNTYYQLNYWVKTNNIPTSGISMRYAVLDPANKYIFNTPWTYGTTDWRKISTGFMVPADYVSGRLDLFWKLNAGEVGWIDDVSLCERECLNP